MKTEVSPKLTIATKPAPLMMKRACIKPYNVSAEQNKALLLSTSPTVEKK
jgi:hypothetical protein